MKALKALPGKEEHQSTAEREYKRKRMAPYRAQTYAGNDSSASKLQPSVSISSGTLERRKLAMQLNAGSLAW